MGNSNEFEVGDNSYSILINKIDDPSGWSDYLQVNRLDQKKFPSAYNKL